MTTQPSPEPIGPSDAPRIVLLHGFPLDRRVMWPLAERLSGDYRVLAPDLPGFGGSASPPAKGIEEMARAVRGELMSRGLLPCVLGGLSMGGYVALAYHRLFRGDLHGLLLLDTRAEADTAEAKANRDRMADVARREGSGAVARLMFPRMLAGGVGAEDPLGREVMSMMTGCPVGTMVAALGAMRERADYTADLAASELPVLVVAGEQDAITPPGPAERLAAACPRGRFVQIPGAGHLAPFERPDEVAAAVRAFMARLT